MCVCVFVCVYGVYHYVMDHSSIFVRFPPTYVLIEDIIYDD